MMRGEATTMEGEGEPEKTASWRERRRDDERRTEERGMREVDRERRER